MSLSARRKPRSPGPELRVGTETIDLLELFDTEVWGRFLALQVPSMSNSPSRSIVTVPTLSSGPGERGFRSGNLAPRKTTTSGTCGPRVEARTPSA